MYHWRKGIASWTVRETLYLSVVFTWDLPEARRLASEWRKKKKRVVAGGPAVTLMPDYLAGAATCERTTPFPALAMHNPMATFTTRGCPNTCGFCAVPRTEGDLIELERWPVRPVVCDNNLLAATDRHFERVIDSLKVLPMVDFNQGLDCRLFEPSHARKFAELPHAKVRFAFDSLAQEEPLVRSVEIARGAGLNDLGVLVLINYEDTPDEAHYRLERVREMGIRPNPMRFHPLYVMEHGTHVSDRWTSYYGSEKQAAHMLIKTMQYYSKLRYVEHIPFEDFRYREDLAHQAELF